MPACSDQTIEEFLKLSIHRRQNELDCVVAGKLDPVDRQERWTVDYNSPKDWMFGLRHGEMVVGRTISPEIFDHIWRISASRPKISLEIRGSAAYALRIKGFQKLSIEIMRKEDFSRRSYVN